MTAINKQTNKGPKTDKPTPKNNKNTVCAPSTRVDDRKRAPAGGHFGSQPRAVSPFSVSTAGGDMSKPSWAKGPVRWNPSRYVQSRGDRRVDFGSADSTGERPPGRWDFYPPNQGRERPPETLSKPRTIFSDRGEGRRDRRDNRQNSGKRSEPQGNPSHSKAVKLGQTSGVYAVGAWAARMEICSLLEAGTPAEEIVQAIRSGLESDHPLPSEPPKSSSSRSERDDRSKSSPRKPGDSEFGESTRSKAPSFPERSSPSPARLDTGLPGVSQASGAGLSFRKRALPPPARLQEDEESIAPTTPPDTPEKSEEASQVTQGIPVETSEKKPEEQLGPFRKKAKPPPEGIQSVSRIPKPPPMSTPVRKDPRTLDKYRSYDTLVRDLFEELVLREVRLELVELVSEAGVINDARLAHYTDPRSPDTGLRYGRLLKRFLLFAEGQKGEDCFSSANIGSFVEHLIESNAGMRTPQAFLYTLEFFSVVFGFGFERNSLRRWKRPADDYAKKAPPRSPAPLLSISLIEYLEKAILDPNRPLADRVTVGKLRLCIQASLRHSDLSYTPLSCIEWCRDRGSTRSLGVARAPITKSGPRPWVASFLGVRPECDDWLVTLMKLMVQTHGSAWQTHNFFGCAPLWTRYVLRLPGLPLSRCRHSKEDVPC